MERRTKRMALAEAIQYQEERVPTVSCMYCGAQMKIEPAPVRFLNMIVMDMPQHTCHQCKDSLSSASIGVAAEDIQRRHQLCGVVTMKELLQAEEADFLHE